jgi:hypothetical protein
MAIGCASADMSPSVQQAVLSCASAAAAAPTPEVLPRFRPTLPEELAFTCDTEDHCETAAVAYKDVKPILLRICRQLEKGPADLVIYDPYYCAGSAIRHLGDLGFSNVYNKYDLWFALRHSCGYDAGAPHAYM